MKASHMILLGFVFVIGSSYLRDVTYHFVDGRLSLGYSDYGFTCTALLLSGLALVAAGTVRVLASDSIL